MKLEDLKENPSNPRRLSDEKRASMIKSLEQFGDLSGFVFNIRTKQLVGGHQKKSIFDAKSTVEIIERYKKPNKQRTVAIGYVIVDGEKYKYREVDVDEDTQKAMAIAANKHSADWDFDRLSVWVRDLDAVKFNLESLGFTGFELENLKATLSVDTVNTSDELSEWIGMPEFKEGSKYITIIFHFKNELARERYAKKYSLKIDTKKSGQWIVYR